MMPGFDNIDPNKVAAILYRPDDDIDSLLAGFARDAIRHGVRLGGIVQQNLRDEAGRLQGMIAIDLMTGKAIPISQRLGSAAGACKLDPAGLAEAAQAVTRAIADDVALMIANKFSKQEAAGRGLRSEMAEAILAGVPILTAVPENCAAAWAAFTGGRGTTLLCARHVVDDWWRELSSRMRTSPIAGSGPLVDLRLFSDHHVR